MVNGGWGGTDKGGLRELDVFSWMLGVRIVLFGLMWIVGWRWGGGGVEGMSSWL